MYSKRIQKIEALLALLPAATLVYKSIKGKRQPYLQWTEEGKSRSKYIKVEDREVILKQMELKKQLQEELKRLKKLQQVAELEHSYSMQEGMLNMVREETPVYQNFRTHVIVGAELRRLISSVKGLERRDCFARLERYVHGQYTGRVCLLYGLRRTGKTTLLFQMIDALSDAEFQQAVYIKLRVTDTMAALNQDLKRLSNSGYRYVFLDEVTLMEDFIDSAALFSDVYAMMGMKIILSGTDSLGFWFTLKQELYDRAVTIHTTYIPFQEYCRLLGIRSIDDYIRYGGTLRMGETAFDDEELWAEEASFRDDETTRRYIDSAICRNIQHSLTCCRDGQYLRHLRELYEANELTGAINRIIESMNHQFLLRTLTRPFRSHDLASAAELLRKQRNPEKRSDILDRIDRDSVIEGLMQLLEIRNLEDQQVGITKAHVAEIREYLQALDLICDCPAETVLPDCEPVEYVLFTQPGMRYAQAQALVHVLLKDARFAAVSQREKDLVCDRILEDVRGRMMEDIVLLETSRSLSSEKRAFKLMLDRSEFDMVIYDSQSCTCEAYEIKHSTQIVPRQYHVLEDAEACAQAERIYGVLTRRCVIYRGESRVLENGVEYVNVEEYLLGR